jgi:hypothetical protein
MDKKENKLKNSCHIVRIYNKKKEEKKISRNLENFFKEHNKKLRIFSLTNLPSPCGCDIPFVNNDTLIEKKLYNMMNNVKIIRCGKLINFKILASDHEVQIITYIKEILPKELSGIICDYACIFHHYSHNITSSNCY